VVLDRRPQAFTRFLAAHQRASLDTAARVETRRLLEMQRHRLLMFTSCGWFFDEISALEPVQILKYAAMALQYLRDLGGGVLEGEFVRRLESAPSNVPDFRDGGDVYRRLIRPAVVDWRRVLAHYAMTGLFDDHPDQTRIYAWRVQRLDETRDSYDDTALRVGRVRVTMDATGDTKDAVYALLHFGGHDFSCGIRGWEDAASYEAIKTDLVRRYGQHSLANTVRALDEHFGRDTYSLSHLFIEERRRVLQSVMRDVLEDHEETYRRNWEASRRLVRYLREQDVPIPEVFRITARHVIQGEIVAWLRTVPDSGAVPERVFELAAEARLLGLTLDLGEAKPFMQRAVAAALEALADGPSVESVGAAVNLITAAERLGVRFGLWRSQNRFFELWSAYPEARGMLRPLAAVLGFNLDAGRPS
jgi:hypothetical protein